MNKLISPQYEGAAVNLFWLVYLIQIGRISLFVFIAVWNKLLLNGSKEDPSVAVPSGKKYTDPFFSKKNSIWSDVFLRSDNFSLLIKIVFADLVNFPISGQLATLAFDKKVTG